MSQSLGHLAGETELTSMALVLKPTAAQDAALTQLIADQQNPASPSYHQWLTPQQFGERFGIAYGDLAILENWLQTRGFTVESVAPSRNRIVFSGTSSTVENAFGVTMQRFRRNEQEFFENSSAVTVPAALSDIIGSVTGLSSYSSLVPQAKHLPIPLTTVSPNYTTGSGTHYLVPWDFRQMFGMNSLSYDGTGITIGVIGRSAVDPQQITYFQQKTGQVVKLPTEVLVPNTGVSNKVSGDEGESELDLEYASGSAPGATVQFIYTGCTSTTTNGVVTSSTKCNNGGVFQALTYAITNYKSAGGPQAQILTLSYGSCEEGYLAGGSSGYEAVLKQGNAQGQTILVSSGDEGAATCDQGTSTTYVASQGLFVSYPASSPSVTAVGGTTISSDSNSDSSTYWGATNSFGGSVKSYVPETSWNDTALYGSIASSGGGVSQLFTKPAWQAGTGVPADGQRDVPDVAFPANVTEHAYLVCTANSPCTSGVISGANNVNFANGNGGLVGGTSASAPNFAAMLAIIEQANGGGALGNINPLLYTLAQGTTYNTVFHDTTTGNNYVNCLTGSMNCSDTATVHESGCPTTQSDYCYGYPAGAGYDLVTGLGSIDAQALSVALSTVTSKTPTLALTLSSSSPAPSTPVTFELNISGTGSTAPTGSVQFAVDGTNVGSAPVANGVATYSYAGFSTTGSHNVTASYSGDGNYNAGNATVAITVQKITPGVTLTFSPSKPIAGAAATITVALTGRGPMPTGNVSVIVDYVQIGFGGTALVNGAATFTYTFGPGTHTVLAQYTGDNDYNATGASQIFSVAATSATLTPTISITASTTSPAIGYSSTLVVAVSGTGGVATGNITPIVDGMAPFGPVSLSGGSASFYYGPTTGGAHIVSALYSGDSTYLPGSSSPVTIMQVSPSFTMGATPSSLTVAAGTSSVFSVTATSVNGFSGSVTPTYTVTTVSGTPWAGCLGYTSGSGSTLLVSPAQTASLPLFVYTSASSCTKASARMLQRLAATDSPVASPWGWTGTAFVSVAGLLGCFCFRRRVHVGALLALSFLALTMGLAGCSGGSGTGSSTTTTSTASAAGGTYVVTLYGTSGTLKASTTLSLTVQ